MAMGLCRAAAHPPDAAVAIAAVVLAQQLTWAMRMLAFATTARCLANSSLPDAKQRATLQWQRALSVAEQGGFPAPELAFLRAYLAYRQPDFERVTQELRLAREGTLLTPDERLALDGLVEHFDPNDRTASMASWTHSSSINGLRVWCITDSRVRAFTNSFVVSP